MKHTVGRAFLSILFIGSYFSLVGTAHADSAAGTVYTPFPECDYFLIQDPTGTYSEAEWYSGVSPDNGDTVYGDFQTYSFQDIYDQNLEGSTHVWIEDYWISSDDALKYTIDNCDGDQIDPAVVSSMSSGSSVYVPPPLPTSGQLAPAPPPSIEVTCPQNSTKTGSTCACNSGYIARSGQCITYTQDCQNTFGLNAVGVQGATGNSSCSCAEGYQWNATNTSCVPVSSAPISAAPAPTPVIPTPQHIHQSPVKAVKKSEPPALILNLTPPAVSTSSATSSGAQVSDSTSQPHSSIWNRIGNWFSALNPLSWFAH